MSLHLYNTLTKKEEVFVPMSEDPSVITLRQAQGENGSARTVLMYTCGPTVYGRAHIGNFSSYLMADLLKRWLLVSGYAVRHVMNITDVGHLVADADTGEDKVEKRAREEFGEVTHESVLKIARGYEEQFIADEKLLNILPPDERPRASEYVEPMKEMIADLLRKDIAYVTEDGIYYDVARFPRYGQLSGNKVEEMKSGARVDINTGKRHPADFALWKFCVGQNEHHALRWSSPPMASGEQLPEGFPGWHIECSAMSSALLGQQIDLHTGGEDNIFPHHECEIAQSEAVTGTAPFVRHWVHKRRIDLKGEKMSKSTGNVLTLDQIIAKGFSPMDLRYYLLSVHYRTHLKFDWKGMEDARKARMRIIEWMNDVMVSLPNHDTANHHVALRQAQGDVISFIDQFRSAMDSDLNTPAALAVVFECMAWSRREGDGTSARSFIEIVRKTFGCFEPEEEALPPDVLARARQMEEARAQKDFATSDRIRDELVKEGYTVKVTPEGTRVTRK